MATRFERDFRAFPRRVSGFNLDELLPEQGFNVARALVGTEGTCAIVLEARVRLIHSPQHRALVGVGYKDAFIAADQVPEVLKFDPIGYEGFEGTIVDGLRAKGAAKLDLLPEGRGIVMVEFGADDPEHARSLAQQLIDHLKAGARAPEHASLHQRGSARTFGVCANPARALPRLLPEQRPSGKVGTTQPSLLKNWAATCATYASSWTSITTQAHSTATMGMDAFTCGSASIFNPKREFAITVSLSSAPPIWLLVTVVRFQANMAMVNLVAHCFPKCSVRS